MANRNQFAASDFIEVIQGSAGIISTIARRVGCDWHTAKKYITDYPTIAQAYADECEKVTDLAETKLIEAINGGDLAAVKYYLSTKGKHRGYVERQEVSGADGGDINIKVRLTGGENE